MEPRPLFDPLSGNQVDEAGNEIAGAPTFNDIAPDGIRHSGGVLYGPLVGPTPIGLGRQGPFSLGELRSGTYEVISETAIANINAPTSNQIQRMVTGEVVATIAGGTPETFSIDMARVSATGTQWVAYPRDDGSMGFTTMRGPFTSNQDVRDILGDGSRLATAREAAYASIMKELIVQNRDRLRELAKEQGLEGGTDEETTYNAARAIMAQMDMTSIRSFSSYLFG